MHRDVDVVMRDSEKRVLEFYDLVKTPVALIVFFFCRCYRLETLCLINSIPVIKIILKFKGDTCDVL